MKILCAYNRGTRWTQEGQARFKGYIQLKDETVLREGDAIRYFQASQSFEEFLHKLEAIQGLFSIILEQDGVTWAAVDTQRSIPLYYSTDLDLLSDSAEAIRQEKGIAREDVSPMRCLHLYGAHYIPYEYTIYDKIQQLDAKTALEIRGNTLRTEIYYQDLTPIKPYSREEALRELESVSEQAVRRAVKAAGDRPIVLSLSGGYDSRYLACTLKNVGAENVTCFAYGPKGSFEVEASRKIARALGYPWHHVEYTDEDMKAILSEENRDFFDFFLSHDHIIYLQNFVALKKLTQQQLLPENAVLMTGVANDAMVGRYCPRLLSDTAVRHYINELTASYPLDEQGLAAFIVDDHFAQFTLAPEARRFFLDEVLRHNRAAGVQVHDYQSFVTAWDDCNLCFAHSRVFPKMNRVHDYFGYETLLPLMDRAILSFWRSVPVEMRLDYNLFEEYVTQVLGAKYDIGEKKTLVPHGKTATVIKMKRLVARCVVKPLYSLGIPLRRRSDVNNFAPLEVMVYQRIRQKAAVKSSRAGASLLLRIYFMEERYGIAWYNKIKKLIH